MEAEWWRECNVNFLPSIAHEHRNRRWSLECRISGSRRDTHYEARYWDLKCVCPTLCNPIDCSPPSSSVHGIFQAKILDWVATSYPRGSYRSWNWRISCIGRLILYHWTTREALWYMRGTPKLIYTRPPWNRQSEMETDGASALVVWKENPLSCAWPQQPRQGLRS